MLEKVPCQVEFDGGSVVLMRLMAVITIEMGRDEIR